MQQYAGVLKINLSSLKKNWRLLQNSYSGGDCGAVVKTNAYGLGVNSVVRALVDEGCRTFFVANYEEGLELRSFVSRGVKVFVLQGCISGMERQFVEHDLIPVLISLPMYRRWHEALSSMQVGDLEEGGKPLAAVKVNTGMNRLGMQPEEFEQIASEESGLALSRVGWVISHLACADDPAHSLNTHQLRVFQSVMSLARQKVPSIKGSLVNSAGIFLPQSWHYDLARPGIGLFGGSMAVLGMPSFHTVVSLSLPILQIRHLGCGESVGYGASFTANRDMTVAIVAGGYGDGILRSLSGVASGWINQPVRMLGRVSMDSCVFDVSDLVGSECLKEGALIELIGEHCCIDGLASAAKTISYELLTRLGDRLEKQYFE